jgi:hypothetical protein
MAASKFYNIPTTEKEIWSAHQQRLAVISRERMAMDREHVHDIRALAASYGGSAKIPDSEKYKLLNSFNDKNAAITEKENKEISRVMREFDAYDARKRTPEPPQQQRGREIDREK